MFCCVNFLALICATFFSPSLTLLPLTPPFSPGDFYLYILSAHIYFFSFLPVLIRKCLVSKATVTATICLVSMSRLIS